MDYERHSLHYQCMYRVSNCLLCLDKGVGEYVGSILYNLIWIIGFFYTILWFFTDMVTIGRNVLTTGDLHQPTMAIAACQLFTLGQNENFP